jgi:hypothetical protein
MTKYLIFMLLQLLALFTGNSNLLYSKKKAKKIFFWLSKAHKLFLKKLADNFQKNH